jgi:hypothetical protein
MNDSDQIENRKRHLGDEFNDKLGEFTEYEVIGDEEQALQVAKQKHTDIRHISRKQDEIYITMLHLTAMFDMATLNNRRMAQVQGRLPVYSGETWSTGIIAKDPTRNNWPVLTSLCKSEGQETQIESKLRSSG